MEIEELKKRPESWPYQWRQKQKHPWCQPSSSVLHCLLHSSRRTIFWDLTSATNVPTQVCSAFFLLPTFLSVSALALVLVFLVPSLHAQAMLPYSFLIACPCSCLLYTVSLCLSCQEEIMRMWMAIMWHYEWPRDKPSFKTAKSD